MQVNLEMFKQNYLERNILNRIYNHFSITEFTIKNLISVITALSNTRLYFEWNMHLFPRIDILNIYLPDIYHLYFKI